jgi:hypothetical protein
MKDGAMKKMSAFRRILTSRGVVLAVCLICIYALTGFFLVPYAIELAASRCNLAANDLWLRDSALSLPEATLSRFRMENGTFHLNEKDLVAFVRMEGGNVHLVRGIDGSINLVNLLSPGDSEGERETPSKPDSAAEPLHRCRQPMIFESFRKP